MAPAQSSLPMPYSNLHLMLWPREFNNRRHQQILLNVPVHTPYLHQSCIFQCTTFIWTLNDSSLVTPWVHQGLICTQLYTNWHAVHSCSIGGGVWCIRDPDQYSCFHDRMLILEMAGFPVAPANLLGLFHSPGGYWSFNLCGNRRSWGRYQQGRRREEKARRKLGSGSLVITMWSWCDGGHHVILCHLNNFVQGYIPPTRWMNPFCVLLLCHQPPATGGLQLLHVGEGAANLGELQWAWWRMVRHFMTSPKGRLPKSCVLARL